MPDEILQEEIKEEDVEETPVEEVFIDETNNERLAEFLDLVETDGPEQVEEKAKDEDKEDDKPEETVEPEEPKETPTPEPEKEPETPIEEVIQKTTEETLKQMGVSEEKKEELEEEGFQFVWEARGEDKPASWLENNKETIRLWQYEEAKKAEALKEKEQELIISAEEKTKQANDYWDEQLTDMRAEGLIPSIAPEIQQKIKDGKALTKAELQDEGIRVQGEIFEKMYQVSVDREAKNLPPVSDAYHIYYRYLSKGRKKPAGATAPVSGGTKTVPAPSSEEISYDEVHNSDFADLLKG
jgi:hypothetical protein